MLLGSTALQKTFLVIASLTIGLTLFDSSMTAIAETSSSLRTGWPGRRFSGGNRCGCIDLPTVALIPETNISTTMSAEPFVYVAVAPMNAPHQSEFILSDGNGNPLYTVSQTLDSEGGIVGFRIPSTLLQVNKRYAWTFSVFANEHHPPEHDSSVTGWIQRVDSEAIQSEIRQQESVSAEQTRSLEDSLALLEIYQSLELWADAITLIVDLREQYPDEESVQEHWMQIIQTLGVTDDRRIPWESAEF